MTSLTFYDGSHCIGGTKILLTSNQTNIFLDFGLNFSSYGQYFDEFLKDRSIMGLHDLLDLDLLPPLKGIYRSDYEISERGVWNKLKGKSNYKQVEVHGILLSHSHLDHTGCIPYLRPEIPIYTSLTSAVIIKLCRIQEEQKVVIYDLKKYRVFLKAVRNGKCQQRQYFVFDHRGIEPSTYEFWSNGGNKELFSQPLITCNNNICKINDIEVRYWPVDHSIPGSGAFAIKTDAGWIAYSGDLRLHGERANKTRDFMNEVAELEPVVLIIEGTHPETEKPTFESEVYANVGDVIKSAEGLVIADFGPRNIERLKNFLKACQENNRRLGILVKDAYLLEALSHSELEIKNPLCEPSIVLYIEAKGTRSTWEKELIEKWLSLCPDRVINANKVNKEQGNFVLCLSYFDIHELLDIRPNGGTYIYSSSESFSEEMHADMDRLRRWTKKFDMKLVGDPGDRKGNGREKGFHASGHIHGEGLKELIELINPKNVIPVHTETPFRFKQNIKNCKLQFSKPGDTLQIWE